MVNLKIIFKNLMQKKMANIFIIIQLSLVFLLIMQSTTSILNVRHRQNDIMSIIKYNHNNVVQLFVNNLNESSKYHENYLELLSQIKQMDEIIDIGSFHSDGIVFEELENEEFVDLKKSIFSKIEKTDQFENTPVLNALYIQSAMIHILEPSIYKGRFFEIEDFKNNNEVPLVVGYAYRDVFEIGQILTVPHGPPGLPGTYRVIGILDNDNYWFNRNNILNTNIQDVSTYCMFPMPQELNENNIFVLSLNSKTLYLVDSNSNIDVVRKKIYDLSREYDMSIRQLTVSEFNHMKNFQSIEAESIKLFTSLIIIILSVFGIISISISKLLSKKREIGIRLSFGTSRTSIISVFTGELFILISISFFISMYLFSSRITSELQNQMGELCNINIYNIGILVIIMTLTFVLSCIAPVKTIKKFSLKDLIGGYE
jgi:ABC-type antimicrobial peptide transport system permease subunit